MGSLCLGVGRWKHKALCTFLRAEPCAPTPESPSRPWPQRGVPPDGEPTTQSIRSRVGAGWRSRAPSGEGFLPVSGASSSGRGLAESPSDGVLEGGCIAPPARRIPPPLCPSQAIRLLGTAPWTQPPSRGRQRPEGPPALGSGPRPLGAHVSFPAPGSSLPVLGGVQTQDAGPKSSLSLRVSAWLWRPMPRPPNSARSSALFPHHFLLLELAG